MERERVDDQPLMGALLRMPVDAWRHRMLEDLHAAGFNDIVPAHSAVLRYPGPQGRRPSDIAAEAGMSRQAMNYLLRELEELGYLKRRDDPQDKRSRRVELTERGYAVRHIMRESVAGIEADLERELGRDKLEQLRQLLTALNASTFVRDYRERTGQPRVMAERPPTHGVPSLAGLTGISAPSPTSDASVRRSLLGSPFDLRRHSPPSQGK